MDLLTAGLNSDRRGTLLAFHSVSCLLQPLCTIHPSGIEVSATGISRHTLVWPSQTSAWGKMSNYWKTSWEAKRSRLSLMPWIPVEERAVSAQVTRTTSTRTITLVGCSSVYKTLSPTRWRSGLPRPNPSDRLAPTAISWYRYFSHTLSCLKVVITPGFRPTKARLFLISLLLTLFRGCRGTSQRLRVVSAMWVRKSRTKDLPNVLSSQQGWLCYCA